MRKVLALALVGALAIPAFAQTIVPVGPQPVPPGTTVSQTGLRAGSVTVYDHYDPTSSGPMIDASDGANSFIFWIRSVGVYGVDDGGLADDGILEAPGPVSIVDYTVWACTSTLADATLFTNLTADEPADPACFSPLDGPVDGGPIPGTSCSFLIPAPPSGFACFSVTCTLGTPIIMNSAATPSRLWMTMNTDAAGADPSAAGTAMWGLFTGSSNCSLGALENECLGPSTGGFCNCDAAGGEAFCDAFGDPLVETCFTEAYAHIGQSEDVFAIRVGAPPPAWDTCFFFGGPPDWANMTWAVTADPAGSCCLSDGSCQVLLETDCTAAGGSYGGDFSDCIDQGACCEGAPGFGCQVTTDACCTGAGFSFVGAGTNCNELLDTDGVALVCDNCALVDNPGQEDCNSDGQGDACDPDAGEVDGDGDGVCDNVDNCPADANPGQEDGDGDGVGDVCDPCPLDNPDDTDGDGSCDSDDICPGQDDFLDTDGDGVPDCLDPCPLDNPDDTDGDGVCDTDDICPGGNDNVDTDGDGVPDFCDPCPLDNPDDSDGDTVCDSDDLCAGEDDLVDADSNEIPDCLEKIPTVSEWGLLIMALLLLTAWKVYFGRREAVA